ncbi:hypothetical protein [uncultured Erythrobacter sp.]|uniref:hypothetical protein n=1 Tax=uncultured Erythrobacter sp. TaxID=263913 RepID=UPI00260B4043|nr:hypothetical protein [uncultured Erythrobacter sp.]
MSAGRIEEAMSRISTAMARIDAVRAKIESRSGKSADAQTGAGESSRVMALVNAHEKLREEVADTLGELDALIEELEA